MASKKHPCHFTDLREDACWRRTIYNSPAPWYERPLLCGLRHFTRAMIGMDLLHVWYLGIARDLCLDLKLAVSFSISSGRFCSPVTPALT